MTNAFIAELVDRAQNASPHLRQGQALMNILSEMDLDLYRKISDNSEVDPFYDDTKIPKFIAYLHIDSIVFDLAKHYGFLVRFCDDMHRFVIMSGDTRSDIDSLFWTSDETTTDFLDSLQNYFIDLGHK